MSTRLRGLYVTRGGGARPAVQFNAKAKPEDDAPAPTDDGRLATLQVEFSRFDSWYEIDDFWEGRFLERTVPGSFKRTIERSGGSIKVLFNHGFDMLTGDRPLTVPEILEERETSPYLEGPLWDTSYNRDLLPGLAAGAYGSSFMFEVLDESWDDNPGRSEHNPNALPERTIREVRLLEAGPVTWPANPESTAGVRMQSGTGWYLEQVEKVDPDRHAEAVRSFTAFRSLRGLASKTPAPGTAPARHVDGISAATRRRRLALIDMGVSSDPR